MHFFAGWNVLALVLMWLPLTAITVLVIWALVLSIQALNAYLRRVRREENALGGGAGAERLGSPRPGPAGPYPAGPRPGEAYPGVPGPSGSERPDPGSEPHPGSDDPQGEPPRG